jgi:hypothetical protein
LLLLLLLLLLRLLLSPECLCCLLLRLWLVPQGVSLLLLLLLLIGLHWPQWLSALYAVYVAAAISSGAPGCAPSIPGRLKCCRPTSCCSCVGVTLLLLPGLLQLLAWLLRLRLLLRLGGRRPALLLVGCLCLPSKQAGIRLLVLLLLLLLAAKLGHCRQQLGLLLLLLPGPLLLLLVVLVLLLLGRVLVSTAATPGVASSRSDAVQQLKDVDVCCKHTGGVGGQ